MKKDRKEKGNCPNLRFPEFEEEWKRTFLSKESIINPKTPALENEFVYIDLESVVKGELINVNQISKSEAPSRAQRVLSDNDILFQCVRPYQLNNYIYHRQDNRQWVASTGYAQIRTKHSINFFYQLLNTPQFNKEVILRCTGTSYPAIASTDLGNIPISICSKTEQAKIGRFLSLLDERIETQNKIIEKLESLIRGIYSATKGESWVMLFLRDVLEERNEQNIHKYPVFSVAVREGVINQIEHLGRSFAAKDTRNYNVVQFGNIVYTKSPTGDFPYGIVKQSFINQPVAVSPLYGVYKPKNYHLGNILHHYFLSSINANNYLYSLIQKGAKNTINITTQRFLDKAILLPTKEIEIKNISLLLDTISKKIHLEKNVLKKLETQKKFILQQMFI